VKMGPVGIITLTQAAARMAAKQIRLQMTDDLTDDLTSSLNALLISLQIPFSLTSPSGLTPSVLLAILGSLPNSHTQISPSNKTDQVHIVKMFLGVMENDILRTDVGLSSMDPRKLANGEENECRYIGELLCWLGRRLVRRLEPGRLIRRKASCAIDTGSIHSDHHCSSGLLDEGPSDLKSNSSRCVCDFLSPIVSSLAISSDLQKTLRLGHIGIADEVKIASFLTQNLKYSVCSFPPQSPGCVPNF
jgi:hypothetical protein